MFPYAEPQTSQIALSVQVAVPPLCPSSATSLSEYSSPQTEQVCAVYPDYNMILVVHSGHTAVIQNVFDSFYENIVANLNILCAASRLFL